MNEDATLVHVGILCTTLCVCSSALGFLPNLRRVLMLPKSVREGMVTAGYLRLAVDVAVAVVEGVGGGRERERRARDVSSPFARIYSFPPRSGADTPFVI